MLRLKGFRFPHEIIAYAVWAYHRFALSTADVVELLAARGVIVSREAVLLWVNRFGQHFADCIRRDRPPPNDKWHMDEAMDHDSWQEVPAEARDRRKWRCARHSRANASKRQSRKALLQKTGCEIWRTQGRRAALS